MMREQGRALLLLPLLLVEEVESGGLLVGGDSRCKTIDRDSTSSSSD